jgi:hypothetical protein
MTVQDYEVATSLDPPSEHFSWFLPYEDHFPKAFIQRLFFIDDSTKERLLPQSSRHYWPPDRSPPPEDYKGPRASGEIRPSIWFDGKIVGRWEIEKKNDEFQIVRDIYRKVSSNVTEILDERQSELEGFINGRLVPISKK